MAEVGEMSRQAVKQLYLDQRVARSYDRDRFGHWAGRLLHALEMRALARILAVVRRAVASPRVLDVPCGTGRITQFLLEKGFVVVGADVSCSMLEVAREKCAAFGDRVSFRPLDLERLDLPDTSFDLITCIRLFHHLGTDDRARVLRELARVSRRFVAVNVSFSSPYYRLRRRWKRRLGQGVSAASSTWQEIASEAAAAGLRLRSHRFVARWLSEDLVLLLEKLPPDHQRKKP